MNRAPCSFKCSAASWWRHHDMSKQVIYMYGFLYTHQRKCPYRIIDTDAQKLLSDALAARHGRTHRCKLRGLIFSSHSLDGVNLHSPTMPSPLEEIKPLFYTSFASSFCFLYRKSKSATQSSSRSHLLVRSSPKVNPSRIGTEVQLTRPSCCNSTLTIFFRQALDHLSWLRLS